MHILRAGERIAAPWKNGGGVTMEVAVHPKGAGFDDFGWRISIARIDRGGPFSSFPGIDRELAMLEGQVLLNVGGRPAVALSADSRPVRFPGDVPAGAELVGEGAVDLNVMTRRGLFASSMIRQRDGATDPDALATFLFPLEPIAVRGSSGEILSRGDAVLLAPGESAALPEADYYRISIFRGENQPQSR